MTDGYSLSDIATATNGGGFGNMDGSWWIIILFLFAFCGWGNGGYGVNGGGSNVKDMYTLSSDFATIQRQLSDGFNSVDNALDRQNAGICDLGYTQAQLINQSNITQMQNANAIQSQLASCCCDVRESIANNSNVLQNAINTGFCQTNFNGQTNTRDIIDSQNNGTRAILDKLSMMESNAKDEKIASLMADNQALKFQASQTAQNAYINCMADGIVNRLQPTPVPAYNVPNPYCGCYSCN